MINLIQILTFATFALATFAAFDLATIATAARNHRRSTRDAFAKYFAQDDAREESR